ncbi:Cytochrome cd1-nitrite reductase-like, heme d1 domain [Pseudocohnilembus persalinus]|uniref:Cytochrome cd1-nitrite reductase-like, heme d1 domain n=1 Tax=Pseudocohnilembus persalinus TaxID=266149 RepID=A0A0V0Q8R0_PSEPJ|nr:Cytochrome cd1-nitrite reductase-like, heme d1 domain [Pseudocohnilembus persalinus]|eukprot:KRW98643.1 Cytochrome cd1-nitrite reductase-like, heme d1 domain [Pseudocohnilembus persalinus]
MSDPYKKVLQFSEYGDINQLKLLLNQHPQLLKDFQNIKDEQGNSALILSVKLNQKSFAQFILSIKPELINQPNFLKQSPLFFAAWNGNEEILNILLKNGADINQQDNQLWTPLIISCYHGHLSIVKTLLKNGADIELQDTYGKKALQRAKNQIIVKEILDKKNIQNANLNQTSVDIQKNSKDEHKNNDDLKEKKQYNGITNPEINEENYHLKTPLQQTKHDFAQNLFSPQSRANQKLSQNNKNNQNILVKNILKYQSAYTTPRQTTPQRQDSQAKLNTCKNNINNANLNYFSNFISSTISQQEEQKNLSQNKSQNNIQNTDITESKQNLNLQTKGQNEVKSVNYIAKNKTNYHNIKKKQKSPKAINHSTTQKNLNNSNEKQFLKTNQSPNNQSSDQKYIQKNHKNKLNVQENKNNIPNLNINLHTRSKSFYTNNNNQNAVQNNSLSQLKKNYSNISFQKEQKIVQQQKQQQQESEQKLQEGSYNYLTFQDQNHFTQQSQNSKQDLEQKQQNECQQKNQLEYTDNEIKQKEFNFTLFPKEQKEDENIFQQQNEVNQTATEFQAQQIPISNQTQSSSTQILSFRNQKNNQENLNQNSQTNIQNQINQTNQNNLNNTNTNNSSLDIISKETKSYNNIQNQVSSPSQNPLNRNQLTNLTNNKENSKNNKTNQEIFIQENEIFDNTLNSNNNTSNNYNNQYELPLSNPKVNYTPDSANQITSSYQKSPLNKLIGKSLSPTVKTGPFEIISQNQNQTQNINYIHQNIDQDKKNNYNSIASTNVVVESNLNYIYVSSSKGELQALDFYNNNKILKQESVCQVIVHLELDPSENFLYVACENEGFQIYTIYKDTEKIFEKVYTYVDDPVYYFVIVQASSNILYCATEDGFFTMDITNPMSPTFIVMVTGLGFADQFEVSDDQKFIFLAKDSNGFETYDISDPSSPELVVFHPFTGTYGVRYIRKHPTLQLVFIMTKWDYVAVVDYGEFYSYSAPYSVPYIEYATFVDETFSEKNDFWFSSNGSHIYMTCQSVGIFLVNIEDIQNMYLYQIISYTQIIKRMYVPPNNDEFIFLTNAKQLLVYQQTSLIYQQKNMFTEYQSELWTGTTLETWPWGQTFTHNYNYLWISLTVDGLRCYDSSKLPELTLLIEYTSAIIPGFYSPFNVQKHLEYDHIIFVGMYVEEALFILDVSDIYNPVKLSSLTFSEKIAYFLLPFPKTADKLSLNIRTDMLIIDVSDLSNPYVYASTDLAEYSVTQMKNQAISLDEQYIYVPEQVINQILTLKISNSFSKIELVDQSEYELVYNCKVSKVHDHILYALTAIGGIRIYSTEKGIPELISEVLLDGMLWQVEFTADEHILYVVATQKNEVQSIDISDLYNPRLIHIFQVSGEQAFQVIFANRTDATNYLVINTFSGVRAIPVENDIELNKQVYKYDTSTLQYESYIFEENELFPSFYVGESGQIKYQVLNNPLLKKIGQFYYYNVDQPEELQESSDFTKFDNANKLVTFEATSENIGFNTIVAKVFIYVDASEIEQDGEIDTYLAEKIYARAQEFGYIDSNGYPTDLFNINQAIILLNDDNLQTYAQHLKQIIKYKIQFVPFSFQVKESLFFNYALSASTSNFGIISTYSQESIEMTLKVQNQYAEFFSQSFQGVLSSYSDDYSEIILQGKMANLNKIMDQIKLEIRDPDYFPLIQVACEIDDQLNNIIDETHYLSEIGFIQINKHVQVGNSIQDQFNALYSGGSITLEEEFQFTFRTDCFKDDDDLEFSMEVYVPEYNSFQEITQSESFQYFDISFQANERLIKGTADRTFYTSTMKININATDGYSTATQQLNIHADKVPFLIIAYYLILGGSSLLSVIGAIQYRGQIYGIFCKSRYRIGNLYYQENEKFKIQIILYKFELKDAQKYLKIIDHYLYKKKFQFNYLLDQTKVNQFIFDRTKIKRIIYRKDPNLDQEGYESEQSYQYQLLKSLLYQKLIEQNKQTNKLLQKLKKYALQNSNLNKHRWYEYYVEIKPAQIKDNYNIVPQIFFKESVLFNALNNIQKKKKNIVKNFLKTITQFGNQVNRQSLGDNYQPIECYELEHEIFRKKINQFQEASYNNNDNNSSNNCYYFLALETLRAQALGFVNQGMLSFLNFTSGQCIKKDTSEVGVAKGMTKRRSIFNPLYKLINMDYVDIPLAQNTPLPQWMDYQCHQGVIELFGQIPQDVSKQTNQTELMIRIEDIFHFICREFFIIQVPIKRQNLLVEIGNNAETQVEKNKEQEEIERMNELKKKLLKKNEDEMFEKITSTYNKLDMSDTTRDEITNYNRNQSQFQPTIKSSINYETNTNNQKIQKINAKNIDQFFKNKQSSLIPAQNNSQLKPTNSSQINQLQNSDSLNLSENINRNQQLYKIQKEKIEKQQQKVQFQEKTLNKVQNPLYNENPVRKRQTSHIQNYQQQLKYNKAYNSSNKLLQNISSYCNNNSKMQLNQNQSTNKDLNDLQQSQLNHTQIYNKNINNNNENENYTFEDQIDNQQQSLNMSDSESEVQDDYITNNYNKSNYNQQQLKKEKKFPNLNSNTNLDINDTDTNNNKSNIITNREQDYTQRILLDLQD